MKNKKNRRGYGRNVVELTWNDQYTFIFDIQGIQKIEITDLKVDNTSQNNKKSSYKHYNITIKSLWPGTMENSQL